MGKIYGAANIDRHIRQHAFKNRDYDASGSIAQGRNGIPHDDSREAARRRRQMERAAQKRQSHG